MLWAAFTVAFFGFLRSAEYVSPYTHTYDADSTLLFSDTQVAQNRINLHIKASKSDPFRHGCTVRLAPTNTLLCPCTAVIQYLHTHPTNTGPLFTYADGSYLTRRHLNRILYTALPNKDPVSSHSFRIGAATSAAAAGFPRWLIQQLGRWNSDCFRTYIRIPKHTIDHVASALSKHHNITSTWDPDLVS